jgi:hypothetical protein
MKRILKTYIFLIFCGCSLSAQSGVGYVYDFLSLPSSPRETALGGGLISIADEDQALAFSNPALLNGKMNNGLAFSHNFLFDGISNGYFSYSRAVERWGIHTHGGVKYVNYGDFKSADIYGNQDGTFSANELALFIGASKAVNERITIGSNLKLIRSQLAGYNSTGIAGDIGFLYQDDNNFSIGFTAKNVGVELSTYDDTQETAPFDIQLGISKKLAHLPFRFSVLFHQLNRWNLKYKSPLNEDTDIFGNVLTSSALSQEIDNFFRHVIFNGELLIGKGEIFRLRIGYNHLRKKELSVSGFRSLGGFSFGFGVKVAKFRLDYGVGHYHLAGAANHISLSMDLDDFFKKKL